MQPDQNPISPQPVDPQINAAPVEIPLQPPTFAPTPPEQSPQPLMPIQPALEPVSVAPPEPEPEPLPQYQPPAVPIQPLPPAEPLQPFPQPLVAAATAPTSADPNVIQPQIAQPYVPPTYTPPSGQPQYDANGRLVTPAAAPQWQPQAPPAQFGSFEPAAPIIMGGAPLSPPQKPKASSKKKLFLFSGVAVFVLLLLCGVVFGLYLPNQPSNVFSTGINRSGSAINSIVAASTTPQKLTAYKSSDIAGTIDASFGNSSYSGNFETKFDQTSLDGGLNFTMKDTSNASKTISAKVLSQIPSGSNFPDIYFQVIGLRALDPNNTAPTITQYDGKWIFAGSDYLKSIGASYLSTSGTSAKQITSSDIAEVSRAATSVTKSYIFSTNKNTAVLTEKKFIGKEKVDGISAYHYTVGIDLPHAKAYCAALENSVLSTNAYKKLSGQSDSDISNLKKSSVKDCNDAVDSGFKSTDTFDMWVDAKYKLIHKIRAYNNGDKNSYVDVGETYKGGDSFALFTDFHEDSQKVDGSFTLNTNFKTNDTTGTITVNSTSADTPGTLKITLSSKSITTPVQITKPTNTVPLQDVLNQFGINSSAISDPTGQGDTKNTKRQTDIQDLQTQLEAYFQTSGNYPSLADMNNPAWRNSNMQSLDPAALEDPDGSAQTLAATPAAKFYAYQPVNAAGMSCENDDTTCTQYTLTATLDNGGGTYVKKNLD